ncbi:O-antigen ligase family protein [Streptomyces mirabilis]|uniref:O-antigen ligase family protein n=1 Tax=Streptomyces mirabilis TaxID=68239 RepID=UPI00368C4C9A
MVVVGSSALTLSQLLTGVKAPFSLAFQAVLAFQTLLLFLRRPFNAPQPEGLAPAICGMLGGAFIALIHAYISGNDGDLFTSFLFMYSMGLVMVVFIAGPVTVWLTRPIQAYIFAALAFGLAQALTGNLMLPQAFKVEYGIFWEKFIGNGKIRVLSFLPSAPRFAELTTFVLLYTFYGISQSAQKRILRFGVSLLMLYILYHTFSRSGYLLLATSVLFLLRYTHATLSTRRDGRLSLAYFGTVWVLVVGVLSLALSPSVKAIGDSTSLNSRFSHWAELQAQVDAYGSTAYLFGTGRSAYGTLFRGDSTFVIDNVFFALMSFGGIVSLVTFLWLFGWTLRALLRARARHPEVTPLLAFVSALPVEGLFLDNHNAILIALFVSIGILNRYAREERAQGLSAVDAGDPSRPRLLTAAQGRTPRGLFLATLPSDCPMLEVSGTPRH